MLYPIMSHDARTASVAQNLLAQNLRAINNEIQKDIPSISVDDDGGGGIQFTQSLKDYMSWNTLLIKCKTVYAI